MDRIILRLYFDHAPIISHLHKYVHYYNNFLAAHRNYNMYLENTDDGVIFFYRDLETYLDIVRELKADDNALIDTPHLYKDDFLLKMFLPRHLFPQNGIRVVFKVVNGPADVIFQESLRYFRLFDLNVVLSSLPPDEGNGFILFAETYRIIEKFTQYLIRRYVET
jgi:hypothetical protein